MYSFQNNTQIYYNMSSLSNNTKICNVTCIWFNLYSYAIYLEFILFNLFLYLFLFFFLEYERIKLINSVNYCRVFCEISQSSDQTSCYKYWPQNSHGEKLNTLQNIKIKLLYTATTNIDKTQNIIFGSH